jgi:hypothetical protein
MTRFGRSYTLDINVGARSSVQIPFLEIPVACSSGQSMFSALHCGIFKVQQADLV